MQGNLPPPPVSTTLRRDPSEELTSNTSTSAASSSSSSSSYFGNQPSVSFASSLPTGRDGRPSGGSRQQPAGSHDFPWDEWILEPVPGQRARDALPQTPREALDRLRAEHTVLLRMKAIIDAQAGALASERRMLEAQMAVLIPPPEGTTPTGDVGAELDADIADIMRALSEQQRAALQRQMGALASTSGLELDEALEPHLTGTTDVPMMDAESTTEFNRLQLIMDEAEALLQHEADF